MDIKLSQQIETSPFDLGHQQAEIENKIVVALERVAEMFRVLLWDQAKRLGLSPIQIQILIFLHNHSHQMATVSHLSREFNLAKPTISDAVAALGRKGLIKRIKSSTDARSCPIRLTKGGTRSVAETEKFANPLKSVVSALSDADKEAFWSILSRLIFASHRDGLIAVQRICYACKYYEQNTDDAYCRLLERELVANDIRADCPEFVEALL